MAKKNLKEIESVKETKVSKTPAKLPPAKSTGFSDLANALSKFSPDCEVLEDSVYAKIKEWIPTGSYIFNAALSGSLFGGMPNNRSLCFAGEEGSGKTYLAMSIGRNAQPMEYNIVFCDSEGAMDPEFARRLGVDPSKVLIQPVSTIEEFSNFAANLTKNIQALKDQGKQPKVMVILDSLGNLSSEKEVTDVIEGNAKRDMTKQQHIRAAFRVNGNKFAKLGIPFIICNHVYEKVGSYIPGKEVSGGGGLKYNASIILQLTKSKLEDKDSEDKVKNSNIDATRVGIVVTITPLKQRFARPIKIQIHIPFYKAPNPFVGLEKFVSWNNCGIVRGKALTEKEYNKLDSDEKQLCHAFTGANGETLYAQPKDTSRSLVCKHLGGEVPLSQLFTEKVFTQDVLKELDEKIIKPTFMLPSIDSLEDLADLSQELGGDDGELEISDVRTDIENYEGPMVGGIKED